MANLIRTLLVEDQEIIRLGIKKMLESISEVDIVAETNSGTDAIKLALEIQPDLILMDIGLPGMDGISATRKIKELLSTKIILLTSRDQEEDVIAGLFAGADAYCLKDLSSIRLANAISSVRDGAVWLDPDIARTLMGAFSKKEDVQPKPAPAKPNVFQLSEREQQVLELLVEGLSNQEMADRLFLSADTIKTHMRHLMEKLRVSDRTQAAVKALRAGIVPS